MFFFFSLVQFHVHVLELRFEVSTEFRTLRFESGRQQTILYWEGIWVQVDIFDLSK